MLETLGIVVLLIFILALRAGLNTVIGKLVGSIGLGGIIVGLILAGGRDSYRRAEIPQAHRSPTTEQQERTRQSSIPAHNSGVDIAANTLGPPPSFVYDVTDNDLLLLQGSRHRGFVVSRKRLWFQCGRSFAIWKRIDI